MAQRKYRILHLTSTANIGGAEQVVLEVARRADRNRFEMIVASLGGEPLLTAACRNGNPPIEAHLWNAGQPYPWRLDRLLPELAKLRKLNVDLVQTYGLRADLVGRLLKSKFGNAKLLGSIHSTDAWRGKTKILLDRWTKNRADWFVSVSRAGSKLRTQREGIDPNKISYIPNGITIDPAGLASREEARRALNVADNDFPVIAHIANLRPMKGHGETLKVARLVLDKHPTALFLLAGRDESGGAYQRDANEMRLADRVRFLGYHPRPREVMRAADLFILPSYYEGCPISILEAMAERRPIVASNVGGIPEQVRDDHEAILIEPRRADLLAHAIMRLAADAALRDRLALAARQRVEREFDVETMVRRYCQLYENLIENRPISIS